jgi:hypothetical protein
VLKIAFSVQNATVVVQYAHDDFFRYTNMLEMRICER